MTAPAFVDPYMPADPIPLLIPGIVIKVFRFASGTMTELPNVEAITCERREGAHPSGATFRYNFAYPSDNAPHSVEAAISTGGGSPPLWTVIENDRLCIQATKPDSSTEWLFDGRALEFSVKLDASEEEVIIKAVGIERLAWATPIPGQYMRDGSSPLVVSDQETDIPAQFNPKGLKNATQAGADAGDNTNGKYPVFIDPGVEGVGGSLRNWDLAMATRYLLFRYNKATDIKNPTGDDIDKLLIGMVPNGTDFDPNNAATYTTSPLIVPDTPITGRDWPSVLAGLLATYGFGFYFSLSGDGSGNPQTSLKLYGRQTGTQKVVMIQAAGSDLDRAYTNTDMVEVQRSLIDVANEWWVEGGLNRYECSFGLTPGFPSAAVDASDFNTLAAFDRNDPSYVTTNFNKYRLYVLDEAGQGHYPAGSGTISLTVPSLAALMTDNAVRLRKPIGDMLALDSNGDPLKARLSISTDYAGAVPGIWDGTGTWQTIDGGWKLCDDRVGILITVENPNDWRIGESTGAGVPYPSGVVKGIEDQAAAGATRFFLRLTCVIEGDTALVAKAKKRDASPVSDTIIRKIDARDRYRKDLQSANSELNTTGDDVIVRNDTDAAQVEADMVRYTTEMGELDGGFRISHITNYYGISDRISRIDGRGLGFRTDSGGAGENPILPSILAIRWTFKPHQNTFLEISDAGSDRGQFRRAIKSGSGERRGAF